MISVLDQRTGEEIICSLSHATDLLGLEENSIYRRLKPENRFEYKHFTVNAKVTIVKSKPRGKSFTRKSPPIKF